MADGVEQCAYLNELFRVSANELAHTLSRAAQSTLTARASG